MLFLNISEKSRTDCSQYSSGPLSITLPSGKILGFFVEVRSNMSNSVVEHPRDRLFSRCNDMRPLLLALANERIPRGIQAKVGASDIVQQTLIEAYQHVHTFQPVDDRHLFNWLAKILMRNLKDVSKSFLLAEKRSVQREQRLPSGWNLPDRKQGTLPIELQEDLVSLSSALTRLPHAHRRVLTWRFFEQMTFPEIAELVGCTEDAVRMQVNRAIGRLAREMSIHDNSSYS